MSRGGLRSRVRIPRDRRYLRDEVMNNLQSPPLLIPVVMPRFFIPLILKSFRQNYYVLLFDSFLSLNYYL